MVSNYSCPLDSVAATPAMRGLKRYVDTYSENHWNKMNDLTDTTN